jgi:hypothetical protein
MRVQYSSRLDNTFKNTKTHCWTVIAKNEDKRPAGLGSTTRSHILSRAYYLVGNKRIVISARLNYITVLVYSQTARIRIRIEETTSISTCAARRVASEPPSFQFVGFRLDKNENRQTTKQFSWGILQECRYCSTTTNHSPDASRLRHPDQ